MKTLTRYGRIVLNLEIDLTGKWVGTGFSKSHEKWPGLKGI